MIHAPEYTAWANMKERCYNEKNDSYANYGGRGITVCKAWRSSHGFVAFFRHMGPKPSPEHTLDRIDNDKGYSPSNCRWATRKQQGLNTRRTLYATLNGERRTVQEWCELLDLNYWTVTTRLQRGWSDERALTQPYPNPRSERI